MKQVVDLTLTSTGMASFAFWRDVTAFLTRCSTAGRCEDTSPDHQAPMPAAAPRPAPVPAAEEAGPLPAGPLPAGPGAPPAPADIAVTFAPALAAS